jgi:hypothetical protein
MEVKWEAFHIWLYQHGPPSPLEANPPFAILKCENETAQKQNRRVTLPFPPSSFHILPQTLCLTSFTYYLEQFTDSLHSLLHFLPSLTPFSPSLTHLLTRFLHSFTVFTKSLAPLSHSLAPCNHSLSSLACSLTHSISTHTLPTFLHLPFLLFTYFWPLLPLSIPFPCFFNSFLSLTFNSFHSLPSLTSFTHSLH